MKTIALLLIATSGLTLQARAEKLVFIVHPSVTANELTAAEVADFYFKRVRSWPGGAKVRFFGNSNSALKALFYRLVLHKSARDIDHFWINEMNVSGQTAPLDAPSDMVVAGVASLPGSIGYVSESEEDLTGVKKIIVKGLE